jgi:penicillin-binding protein 1A
MNRRGRTRKGGSAAGRVGWLPTRLRGWQARVAGGAVLALLLAGGTGWVLWERCGLAGCPDPTVLVTYSPGDAPVLLDRSGAVFARLHPLRVEALPLESLPGHLAEAFVAVEDRRFRSHGGVDWIRVVGAAARNLPGRTRAQGASTLTMQLARSVFPDQISRTDRTLRRKLVEARVARSIEARFSKDRILELYLNHVYLGITSPGVGAAARHYFGVEAGDLTLAQSALLAGLARAPASYDPRRNPERATARRDLVLSLMEAQGRITPEEAAAARATSLEVPDTPGPRPPSTRAPWFVDQVRAEVERVLGPRAHTPRLRIHTTLDTGAQEAAEEALAARLTAIERGAFGRYRGPAFDPLAPGDASGTDHLQGAVVVMEVATGDVLALVGGRDHAHSSFNRAVAGRRPPGSAFKPVVYAAALGNGFVPSQPLLDRPFRLATRGAADWTPRNHDGTFRGTVGMRESLVHSLNVPTARLGLAVGIPRIIATARALGIESPMPEAPSLSLGTAAVSPLELTVAYATLAASGTRPVPRFLHRVETENGEVLLESTPSTMEVMDRRVAWMVTGMLQDAVRSGTGQGARSGGVRGAVAGKTGTTQDATDVWFSGYTPEWAATVWIGFDRPRPILPAASGGLLAAPVFGRTLARLQEGGEIPSGWPVPDGIVEARFDPETGLVPAVGCASFPGNLQREAFLAEALPAAAECEAPGGVIRRLAGALRGFLFGGRGRQEAGDRPAPRRGGTVPDGVEPLVLPPTGESGDGESFLGVPRVRLATRPG